MPVSKCPNGKWKIGNGKCIYDSKAKAERAYKGYMAHKHINEVKNELRELRMDSETKREKVDRLIKEMEEELIKTKIKEKEDADE